MHPFFPIHSLVPSIHQHPLSSPFHIHQHPLSSLGYTTSFYLESNKPFLSLFFLSYKTSFYLESYGLSLSLS
eukprot:c35176_g1_i1 orf=2-214(-)